MEAVTSVTVQSAWYLVCRLMLMGCFFSDYIIILTLLSTVSNMFALKQSLIVIKLWAKDSLTSKSTSVRVILAGLVIVYSSLFALNVVNLFLFVVEILTGELFSQACWIVTLFSGE